MAIHQSPPPGTMTIEQVCQQLKMNRSNFYRSGLVDILDSWQMSANAPRLFLKDDVRKLRYWLLVRQAQIALGVIPANYPLKPDFDLDAWFEEDPDGVECSQCAESAFIDWDTGRVWCAQCGIIENSK